MFRAGSSWGSRAFPHGEHEVGQSEEDVELVLVLGQSPVAGLPVAKEILYDVAGVFDEGPHLGLGLLRRFDELLLGACGQRPDRAALAGDLPVDPALGIFGPERVALLHAPVAGGGVTYIAAIPALAGEIIVTAACWLTWFLTPIRLS